MHFFFTAFWEEVILDHPSGGAASRSGRPTFYHGEGAVVVVFVETKLPSVFQIRWRCPRGQLQGNKLTSPCPMVPALWKMVRICRAICREWSQRWWKKTRYDSWHVFFFHKLRNNRHYLGVICIQIEYIHRHICDMVAGFGRFVYLSFLIPLWHLLFEVREWPLPFRKEFNLDQFSQWQFPIQVECLKAQLVCNQRTYLFHPGGSSLCVCSALANSWCWIGQFFPSAVVFFLR